MAGRTVISNVDYALQTQTVEDATHFSLIVTITAPTAAQLNALGGAPLTLLPDRLVSRSSRGVARRVFLHRGWIRSGTTPPAATTAAFVFQDSSPINIATLAQTSGVFTANVGVDFVANAATGVTLAAGAHGGLTDSKGIRLTQTGTFTGGPYSDITIGLFGVILPTGTTTSLGSSPTVTQFGKSA
jgi:hypothetical protein